LRKLLILLFQGRVAFKTDQRALILSKFFFGFYQYPASPCCVSSVEQGFVLKYWALWHEKKKNYALAYLSLYYQQTEVESYVLFFFGFTSMDKERCPV
jgi:hypothetical protein